MDLCWFCEGTGERDDNWPCGICRGTGVAEIRLMEMEYACAGFSRVPCRSCGGRGVMWG